MIKITKTIVGPDRKLLGFMMEGKEKEFGGISSEKTVRPISLAELMQKNFSNNQISVSGGRFITANNFKINSVPMCVYDGVQYHDVDNTINLTKRFVKDNENIGFEVTFADGSKQNLTYDSIGNLVNWYKPGNFVIRTSSNNKYYIAGKPGVLKLEDLPAEVIGGASTAKKVKPTAKKVEKEKDLTTGLESSIDILSVYDFVNSCNGVVIRRASDKYDTDKNYIEHDIKAGFIPMNIGEYASATPQFTANKLNVNAGFKKPGTVSVHIPGLHDDMLPTFVFRTKSIFYNGDNIMKRFSIAIPQNKEQDLINTLGGSLALSKVTDPILVGHICQATQKPGLVVYDLDTNNVALISKDRRDKSLLSNDELTKVLIDRYINNLIKKTFSPSTGYLGELKKSLSDMCLVSMEITGKTLHPKFKGKDPSTVATLQNMGFDVYTGAFDPVKALGGTPSKVEKKDDKSEVAGTINIDYIIKGFDPKKITYSMIKEAAANNDASVVPESIIKLFNKVLSISDVTERAKEAKRLHDEAVAKLYSIDKKLWLNNASAYINGGKARLILKDTDEWKLNTATRFKSGKEYVYTKDDITVLLRLTNTTL